MDKVLYIFYFGFFTCVTWDILCRSFNIIPIPLNKRFSCYAGSMDIKSGVICCLLLIFFISSLFLELCMFSFVLALFFCNYSL